ncbi:hypothetical protein [uncultured Aquincola sp.]|uniref:hypothetical protein n=1 Tax=uncultured Aquincola sp. TaxID=886556 RepID=UPI0032B23C49
MSTCTAPRRHPLPMLAGLPALLCLFMGSARAEPWADPGPAVAPAGLRVQWLKPVARKSLLGPAAFAAPSTCSLDPFADANPEQRERQLERADVSGGMGYGCTGERMAMNVAAPPPAVTSNARMRRFDLSIDQWMSTRLADQLTTSARLGVKASGDPTVRSQAARALVAAGSMLRLNDDWAMELQFGRDKDTTALRSRAKWSTLWRVAGEHLMYLQLASEPAGTAQTVGMRWWLVPRRATLDVSAYRPVDTQRVEPRLGLSVTLGR